MDDAIRGNQRRRESQIYREDDRTTIRRRQTNRVMIEPQNEADNETFSLSLSLGPTTYPSSITSPLRLPPPSPFPLPSPDLVARMASSSAYFMTSPPYLSLNNSFHQIGSMDPPVNFFPSSAFATPSNQTPARSLSSAVESHQCSGSQSAGKQKSNTIPPPFPWATNKRGKIHSLEYLESKQITTIKGDVQCKHCDKVYQVSYNLRERFSEVEKIFMMRKRIMRERAPPMWTNPEPGRCRLCGREKAVKPVIAERKSKINWLFLLLGQTLGYCTLEQLKNFCKHSNSHRTGAKDRVLYLTYLGLCQMLEPNRETFRR